MSNFSQEASHIVIAHWGEDESYLIDEVSHSLSIGRDYATELVRVAIIEELILDEGIEDVNFEEEVTM